MVSVIEDSDDEYLDDPIRLVDFEQKRIKTICTFVQESIELSDSDVDVVSLPTPKSIELAKPAKPSYKIVSSTLPVTFFEISRNIELLYKCLPLRIKIVDCDKHPWYYRRKYKNIKFGNIVFNAINENIKKCRDSVESTVDEETMKLKIRPVDVQSYLKSPIRDIKTAMCRQNNNNRNKHVLKGPDEKNISPRNIDFKKNKGLVGLKIVYDVNIKGSKNENNKDLNEAKISKNDSQNKKDKDVEIKESPENHHKKGDVKPFPGFVCKSDSNRVNHEEKHNLVNTESLKLQRTSKFTEGKICTVNGSSQAQGEFASKKDKKCCDQKTKPKVAKEQKVIKERKVTQTHKIDQNNKSSNIEETNVVTQKNEMKEVHNKIKNNDKMAQKFTRSKRAISKTSEKESISKNESCQKSNLDYDVHSLKMSSNIVKDSKKSALEKRKVPNNVDKHFEQRQDNPQKSEKGIHKDQLPLSMARVSMGINSQDIQKKSLTPSNKELRNDIKDVNNHLSVPSIMRPHTEKSFILTDINDRKIDVFASQVPGRWLTIGQRNPKEMLSSLDLPINNKNCMKTYVDSKSESKVLINEGYTDNKIPKNSSQIRSQMLLTSKVANGHSNVKSVLKAPASSKNEQKNELQRKQELCKQPFNIGSSEYAPNKQVPSPNKKVVIYPVSHYNVLGENKRPTSDIAAQEKRSMFNGKLATSHSSLSTHTPTIPTSVNQTMPSLDPRLVRYQLISQNVSLPKELPKSVSQTHKKMVSTPPTNTKITPNILNHARIIIKRPTSEANSIPGQQLAEKLYCSNVSPNKTLKLIPTLTSTQKGRYIIINKNFVNKNNLVREQHPNFGPNNKQEHLQQHNMPKLDNTPLLNQTSNEYLVPGVSPHKNQVAPKEGSTNKRPSLNQAPLPNQQPNSYRQNELHKGNSTQYTNLQLSQPNISAHNYDHNAVQPPLPNSLPHPNPQLPHYVHNEHMQYYNDNSLQNTNEVPLSNQDPKQNEYGCYYDSNTMLHTEQPPLQTQANPNEYDSYYSHSTLLNSYQGSYHQGNPNGNGSGPNQNTILNLDTNTLMQPPPLYFPQNINDMDCAYWNGVNYLGDEWQQGYPQPTQPPSSTFPQYMTPPPEYQHPSPLPYPQNLQHPPPNLQHPPPNLQHPPPNLQHPPPNMQHPLPPSDIPPQCTVPQYPQPSPVSQNPPPLAATQYPQPASFTQHPPPPVPQHPSPALPHPSSYLLPTVTQGSTILGSNNNGVVRTINLVTSTTTAPKVSTSKNSSSDENNIPVNTKSEMLQELSKSMDIGSPNLKRSRSDSNKELSKFPNGNIPSGPLAKVRKIEGLVADPPSVQKALNNGYSPPILPIPTYEKTFEYIAQVSGSMEKTSNNRVNEILDKCNGKKIESILKKKPDFDGYADGDKGDKSVKKISIDEYKNRANDNKTERKDVVKTEIKSESKFDDTDLGYDSDSTVILPYIF